MRYWELVLEQSWEPVKLIRPPKVKHYPDILVADEINTTFKHVNRTHYRVFLYTVYTLGIRLSEALFLEVGDIDGKTMRVHIREGKGCKDRFVILPDNTYQVLKQFWRTHRHEQWLFPSLQPERYSSPMDKGRAQVAMKKAITAANIHKRISIHNLRHSFATHCVEHGMDLCSLQELIPKAKQRRSKRVHYRVKNLWRWYCNIRYPGVLDGRVIMVFYMEMPSTF